MIFIAAFSIIYPIVLFLIYKSSTNNLASSGYFWFFIGIPVIFILSIILLMCLGKRMSELNTKERVISVQQACTYIN